MFFVLFMYVYSNSLSALVYGLFPPSKNSIAVSININNNNNNNYQTLSVSSSLKVGNRIARLYKMLKIKNKTLAAYPNSHRALLLICFIGKEVETVVSVVSA